MKEKMVAIKTDLFGILKIEFILLEEAFPRIFIAASENKERFLLCENESTKNRYSWFLMKISNEDIVALDDGRKKVSDIYSQNKNKRFVILDKENSQAKVVNFFDKENLTFINKEIRNGFLNNKEREESKTKEANLDFEKVQLLQKTQKDGENPEEFDFSTEKKIKNDFEVEEDFESFEVEEKKVEKKKTFESKDEFQEDLENYEEVFDSTPEIEEGETQKNYFDDWDYKNSEKKALEEQRKKERKEKRLLKKEERKRAADAFLQKISDVLHDKKFWIRVILCLVILAMFISVFVAVFAGRGDGGEQIVEIPGNQEEMGEVITNLMLKILK